MFANRCFVDVINLNAHLACLELEEIATAKFRDALAY
jgi:hypothetical protein